MIIDSLNDIEILALTIIGEARGENIEGQVAVGSVIRNRVIKHSLTYKEICLAPKQFSCWNKTDSNYAYLTDLAEKMFDNQELAEISLKQCVFVAHGIFAGEIKDNTNGALHYMTLALFDGNRPAWARFPVSTFVEIGHQVFFNV